MTDVTRTLARASGSHPVRTLVLWGITVAVSIGVIAVFLPSALTTDSEMTNNPESYRGYDLLREHFPPSPGGVVNEVVIVRSQERTVGQPDFEQHVRALVVALASTGYVESAHSVYDSRDRSLVSPDRHAALVTVGLAPGGDEGIAEIVDAVDAAERDGFETAITGEFTADEDYQRLSQDDLEKGELQFGLPAALIVLLLVFGSIVAGLVPVVTALVAIVVALALTALVGQAFELSFFVVNMLTGMGLALGIDYALFIVSRYREERNRDRPKLDAITVSGATASRAVLFSGTAFVLAMLGMLLVPDTILRSLATGAILVGIVSVVAALTLLPAILGLLGDGVNALRIPWLGRRIEESAGTEGRTWSRIVRAVMRAPLVSAAASVAVLVALAIPVLDFETGFSGIRTLPDRFAAKQGFVALEQSFGVGTVDDVQVVVEGDIGSPAVRRGLEQVAAALRSSPLFRDVEVRDAPDGQAAVVDALIVGDSRDSRSVAAVERLRDDVVPAAFGGADTTALVTGETAETIDYRNLTSTWLPIVFAFVLGLSFLLLLLAFRSIVLPAVAIALNLLSVGAAYGLLVLVFVEGIGADLLGFTQVEVIAAWLPLFLFSVLFGLSMDYTVFLLSRVREHHHAGEQTRDAVAHAVGSTARIITGAALIIIMVFVGFASGDQVEFQQMGFGIAVSLLIDATLIRLVLMPAVLAQLGERVWYLPPWLKWLPHLEIEGVEETDVVTA
jgi:putative drug exporter of the RND superfamily